MFDLEEGGQDADHAKNVPRMLHQVLMQHVWNVIFRTPLYHAHPCLQVSGGCIWRCDMREGW
ncbi:MAG: hypothetical protein B7Y40_02310 [Gammaproteobacteria bacterium 28-57-27]|nr:MAG: hypothetical protein B7Y40_02310 [Gammaproteobacteria bacterium 28-57-27]